MPVASTTGVPAIEVERGDGPARDRLAGRRGHVGRDRCRRGHTGPSAGVAPVTVGTGPLKRGDVDRHEGRRRRHARHVGDDVPERVGADEARVRRVDERAVGVEADGAAERRAVELRGQHVGRVHVAVVGEHAGGHHRQRVVAGRGVRVVHRERPGGTTSIVTVTVEEVSPARSVDEVREAVEAREPWARRVAERAVGAEQQVPCVHAGAEVRLHPVARVGVAVVAEQARGRDVERGARCRRGSCPAAPPAGGSARSRSPSPRPDRRRRTCRRPCR